MSAFGDMMYGLAVSVGFVAPQEKRSDEERMEKHQRLSWKMQGRPMMETAAQAAKRRAEPILAQGAVRCLECGGVRKMELSKIPADVVFLLEGCERCALGQMYDETVGTFHAGYEASAEWVLRHLEKKREESFASIRRNPDGTTEATKASVARVYAGAIAAVKTVIEHGCEWPDQGANFTSWRSDGWRTVIQGERVHTFKS